MNPWMRFTSAAVMSRGRTRRATSVSRIGKGYSIRPRPAGGSCTTFVVSASPVDWRWDVLSRAGPGAPRAVLESRVVGFHVPGSFTYVKNDSTALRNLLAYASKLVGLYSRACTFLNLRMESSTSSPVTSTFSQLSRTPNTFAHAARRADALFLFMTPLAAAQFQCSTNCFAVVFIKYDAILCDAEFRVNWNLAQPNRIVRAKRSPLLRSMLGSDSEVPRLLHRHSRRRTLTPIVIRRCPRYFQSQLLDMPQSICATVSRFRPGAVACIHYGASRGAR